MSLVLRSLCSQENYLLERKAWYTSQRMLNYTSPSVQGRFKYMCLANSLFTGSPERLKASHETVAVTGLPAADEWLMKLFPPSSTTVTQHTCYNNC